MHEKSLSFPSSVLEQLYCSSCNGYLSCGPVRVLPDGSCICGRCTPPHNDVPIYRALAFEAVLNRTLFPCRFNKRGCTKSLCFGQAIEHESKCAYRSFLCPVVPYVDCTWKGSASEMFAHFSELHSEFIMQNVEFKLGLDKDAQELLMVNNDGVAYILKYRYNSSKNDLKYEIGYCKNEPVHDAAYKIELFNDSNSDSSISLKTTQCMPYSETFYELQNPTILNLGNYLQNLDNPTRVALRFSVTQSGVVNSIVGVNHDLLKKLRCENCHNYLIPPLFDLKGRAVCCDCSEVHPECSLLNDRKTQKLVAQTKFPCRWRSCTFVGKSDCYKAHELNCQYRQYNCFFPSCQVTFELVSAIEHLQSHRAQYLPDKIVYKTQFAQTYSIKHVFTIKNNAVILIQHSVIDLEAEQPYTHRVALFSSEPREIAGNIDFEHQHCRLKSKPFLVINKHNTDVTLNKLPICFKSNDELTVVVNI